MSIIVQRSARCLSRGINIACLVGYSPRHRRRLLRAPHLPAGDAVSLSARRSLGGEGVRLARGCRIGHPVTSLRVSIIIPPNKEIQIGQK